MKSNHILQEFNTKMRLRRRRKWYYTVSTMLAAMVVFVTVYALILPAITQNNAIQPSCGLSEHEHTLDCYPEYHETVMDVIRDLKALPSYEEMEETFGALEEEGDEDGYAAYQESLHMLYMEAYVAYNNLDLILQPFVSNSELLDQYSWLYSAELTALSDWINVYYRNYFNSNSANSNGKYASIYTNPGTTAKSVTLTSWWRGIIASKVGNSYRVTAVYSDIGTARTLSIPAGGFFLTYHPNYGGGTGFQLTAQVGDWVTFKGDLTNSTVVSSVGAALYTIHFDHTPKDEKDNTSKLQVVQGADTNEFIEINLYNYGTDINEPYNTNSKYPGFQQGGGTSSVDTTRTSFYSGYFNWGDAIVEDFKAGIGGVVNKGVSLNNKIMITDSYGNSTMRPLSGQMGTTLNADGWPQLRDGTSLGYLFGESVNITGTTKTYATKVNTGSSVNGLFQLNDETGVYTYDSHNNHAQFVAGTNGGDDHFTLYRQVISPNYMMYPFGNFLPFADIVHDAQQSDMFDHYYLQKLANSAIDKSVNGHADDEFNNTSNPFYSSVAMRTPYKTLNSALMNFVSLLDKVMGNNTYTGIAGVNQYFRSAGIKKPNGNYVTFTDSQISNIYTLDYDVPTNFFFGMEMKMKFVQSRNGTTSKGKDMILRFTGDDDVWIYVDDVLFLDLSGIHRHVGGEIDFKRGVVRYYDFDQRTGDVSMSDNGGTPYRTVTFKELFEAAGKSTADMKYMGTSNGTPLYTFEDYSIHTINFYYMERGSGSGVCRLEFNMEQTAPTGIYKVDQYGSKVAGAAFAMYAANENYQYLNGLNGSVINSPISSIDKETGRIYFENGMSVLPLYTGRTDENGEMLLVNEKGKYLSAGEIRTRLGEHFILREIDIPPGYRTVCDESYLYFDEDLILCDNVYESGTWISPNATVRATETLAVAHPSTVDPAVLNAVGAVNGSINYYQMADGEIVSGPNGTLFAVVAKRNGRELNDYENWYPVTGSDTAGYHVMTEGGISAAITAAQTYRKDGVYTHAFSVGELIFNSASGVQIVDTLGMVDIIRELPGDPTTYYTYIYDRYNGIENEKFEEAEYIVLYYYTSAASLADATAANTVRISSHVHPDNSATSNFTVQWTATINIPNVIDTLYFQKVDGEERMVNNAVFGLYDAVADSTGLGYYIAKNGADTVYVLLDTDGETARVFDADFNPIGSAGTYRIADFSFTPRPQVDKGMIDHPNAGWIIVNANGQTYTIYPTTNSQAGGSVPMVGYTHAACDTVNDNGTGHFMYLSEGDYFLREIQPPTGYTINNANIKVSVNPHGVYANAGTANNGVKVGNGIGYVVKTLDVFASVGDISDTLSWVYTMLRVYDDTGFLHDLNPTEWTQYAIDDKPDDGFPNISTGVPSALTPNRDPYDLTATKYPMINYLVYDGEANSSNASEEIIGMALFEYARYVRPDDLACIPGIASTRIWTETGWSDLEIFQDTQYGLLYSGTDTAYRILADNVNGNYVPYDISHLYSSPTFVRVTDKKLIDVTVEKVDVVNPSTKLANAGFALYKLEGDVAKYHTYDTAKGKAVWTPLQEGETDRTYQVMTDASGRATFRGLTDGVYYLMETTAPGGYDRLRSAIQITVRDGRIIETGNPTYSAITAQATLQVKNSTGYRMPETGGVGVEWFYRSGMLLLLLSGALLLLLQVRKRVRKAE